MTKLEKLAVGMFVIGATTAILIVEKKVNVALATNDAILRTLEEQGIIQNLQIGE